MEPNGFVELINVILNISIEKNRKMKLILNICGLLLAMYSANAQVAIEKDYSGNPSVLLEFNDTRLAAKTAGAGTISVSGDNKTLILPVVSNINAGSQEGTLWFDANDDKIKYKSATAVVEITDSGSDESSPKSLDPTLNEIAAEQGTILGANSSSAPGILVLESTTKAMVLPVVEGVAQVINPEPGSIVYDRIEKAVALYNGITWTFLGDYTAP